MSNGNFSKTKLGSSAAPSVRDKMAFYVLVMGADAAASARAISVDRDVDRHTMRICELDEHKGELARVMTEMDVRCADPAPAPVHSRTFITLMIDQKTRSICGVRVPPGQRHGIFKDSQSNKENANV
ncbi:hypothetical protein ACC786_13735 [Rhizobium ruizarguesonis]|uniref:hypothetical protein n=1 Tax=Rhizobium ruizarguesonis TaxID=2081791 RepID=UPI0010303C40|nr:hypothetical protein [Rhizobium ruizarguesonis]TAT96176.1 hypothetical protein ELI55_27060 [Rhizobium ruizarguesonis]